MSNTATTLTMLPIAAAVLETLDANRDALASQQKQQEGAAGGPSKGLSDDFLARFRVVFLLGVAYSSTIGKRPSCVPAAS